MVGVDGGVCAGVIAQNHGISGVVDVVFPQLSLNLILSLMCSMGIVVSFLVIGALHSQSEPMASLRRATWPSIFILALLLFL